MDKWLSLAALSTRKFFFNGSMKANGIILGDMVTKLCTSYTLVAWAFAIQNGLAYLITPATKLLLNRFTDRQLCILGGSLVGCSYIICGVWVSSVSQLLLIFIASGMGFGLMGYPTYMNLQRHFPENISTMSAFASLFDFFGVAILPPLLQYLKDEYGLVESLVLFGTIMLNLTAVGVSMRRPPLTREVHQSTIGDNPSDQYASEHNYTESGGGREAQQPAGAWRQSGRAFIADIVSLSAHTNVMVILCIDFFINYVYISWALFLVSLGTSIGLSEEKAAFLSTIGGVGGLAGKVGAVVLFRYNYVNAYTCCVTPLIAGGICLLGSSLVEHFAGLAPLTFFSGVIIGLISSIVYGSLPVLVCKQHLPRAVVVSYLVNGVAVQFGGFFSGLVYEMLGSTSYVYAFDGFLCFLAALVSLLWARGDQTIGKCNTEDDSE